MNRHTFTKTVAGIEYNVSVIVRENGGKTVTFTHNTEKGIRAVAFNATTKLAALNRAFATEINGAK